MDEWSWKKAEAYDFFLPNLDCASAAAPSSFCYEYNVIDTPNSYLGNEILMNNGLEWKNE